jgi:ABC-2 type transport system permease protein
MFRGLWRLTWLEIKIFVREPMGLFGSVGMPVVAFVVLARMFGPSGARLFGPSGQPVSPKVPLFMSVDLPILACVLIAVNTVLSLIAIMAIYREGGILKRLRATPLRPHTILIAHVLVKLLFTAVTFALTMLAGRRYYPAGGHLPIASFTAALLFSTMSIVSMGFPIASAVPTARFAQPIGALIVYPMLGLCGLFVPIESLPPMARAASRVLPFTYAVSLLRGVWHGEAWSAHLGDVAVLMLMFAVFTAAAGRVFRWE